MELGQKIGAAILMVIPAFVGAVIIYQEFIHSYFVSLIWAAVMVVVYWALITGRIFKFKTQQT